MVGPLVTDDAPYRLAALALLGAGMGVSITFRHRAERAGEPVSYAAEPLWLRIPLRLAGLAFLASFLTWLVHPPAAAWASFAVPPALRWAGAVVGLATLPGLWWVFTTLGRNITRTVVTRRRHTLVTGGPYRWVRHPLYSIAVVTWLGLGLLMANVFVMLVAAAAFGVLVRRTDIEEAMLVKRFGARYRAYMARTGRFFPRF